jgi:hypothetical protein
MREAIARWTCNSCGSVEETPSDKQPKGWVGYSMTETGVPAGELPVLGHLCDGCRRRVESALEGR